MDEVKPIVRLHHTEYAIVAITGAARTCIAISMCNNVIHNELAKPVVTTTQSNDPPTCLNSGEGEYLFTPYSVFTVRKVKWSDDRTEPHSITIAAALDNALEPDDLPLAPW